MIGRLNHVAIVVPDLAAASALYSTGLGAKSIGTGRSAGTWRDDGFRSAAQYQDRTAAPVGESSPIAGFLAKNPSGGMHHVCYEVTDILATLQSF